MTESGAPTLSVVIATREIFETLDELMLVLLPQMLAVGGEVVLVGGGSAPLGDAPPGARYVPTAELDLVRLRARSLAEARGDVIAIGEDHAYPLAGWAEAVLRAHRAHPAVPIVVGCLANGTKKTAAHRANFLAFASPFMPPMVDVPSRPPAISASTACGAAVGLRWGAGRAPQVAA